MSSFISYLLNFTYLSRDYDKQLQLSLNCKEPKEEAMTFSLFLCGIISICFNAPSFHKLLLSYFLNLWKTHDGFETLDEVGQFHFICLQKSFV